MTEINLIPRDYGEAKRLRRWLRRFGLALAMVAASTAIGRGWIAVRLSDERPSVEQLREQAKQAADRQARLAALELRRSAAATRLASLQALREGTAWVAMFRAIDHAYNRKLWFDELAFARALRIDSPPPSVSAAGDAAIPPAKGALPRISQGFDIKGHALDHAAITEFMRAIGERPGVAAVRLTDTGLRKYSTQEVVDFGLAATLDPSGPAAR